MGQRSIALLENEEIIFEGDTVVLTNRRLLANWESAEAAEASDEAFLIDIVGFQKINGGRTGRLEQGLLSFAAGSALIALEFVVSTIPEIVETVVFVLGSLGVLVGTYLVVGSILVVKPNTTVFFEVPEAKNIPVSFPGWDNADADRLTRLYGRAKRGL